jgi:hypothetical protein
MLQQSLVSEGTPARPTRTASGVRAPLSDRHPKDNMENFDRYFSSKLSTPPECSYLSGSDDRGCYTKLPRDRTHAARRRAEVTS